MKRKTYRIVWEDDPPRHDAQPSENRAPDTAGRNHAGPAFEQQQSNGMPPTSGAPDMPADETTRGSADKTGSGFVRSETTEQRPSQAIASPTASHPAEQTVEKLTALGIIDSTLCKVLAVREHVRDIMETGIRKTDAMWLATERFACSYEYVRKCMYYYTDMNIG